VISRGAAVGILGGTFDPVHYGHLRMADEIAVALKLADVRLVPAGNPYHRTNDAPPTPRMQRLAMCRLAVEEFPRLSVDPREALRDTPSYTVDTLTSIREEVGATSPIMLILGADTFVTLPTWSRWTDLFALAHIVIVPRPGFTMPNPLLPALNSAYNSRLTTDKALLSKGFGRIYIQTVAPNAISATRLREMTWGYQSIERYTPKKVAEYIEAHNLYRS
jgi:nicotinate-nucleotide adenylyltransferase